MPKQYCFICASDEGVFLDVTEENKKTFHEQLETCSISKGYSVAEKVPTKVCYKCAYELNQCSSFVKKYKRGVSEQSKRSENCCSFCLESAKKGYIFDLNKDTNPLYNPYYKVQNLFNSDLKPHAVENTLICLSCRYTVDVLFDLKCVFEETIIKLQSRVHEEIDYLSFPKTKTTVVSRKTTTTEFAKLKLSTPSDSDNDSDMMARGRTRITKLNNNKTSAVRKMRYCGKCENPVDSGSDMYRFHRTGLTVCKSCWITIDPVTRKAKKRSRQSSTETKLCTVFLKDVLTDSELKERKVYRVEQDDEGNKVYIITDDSSENESKLQKGLPGATKASTNNTESDTRRVCLKRAAKSKKSDSTESEDRLNKKLKPDVVEIKVKHTPAILTRRYSMQKLNNSASALPTAMATRSRITPRSDSELNIAEATRSSDLPPSSVTRSVSALSDAEMDNRSNRKRLRNILQATATSEIVIVSDSSSSNEDTTSRRKKKRVASASPTLSEMQRNKKEISKRTRSNSTSGNEESSVKFRIPTRKRSRLSPVSSSETSQKSQSEDETDIKDLIMEKKEFVCEECGDIYGSKLEVLTHKLTHFSQPEIKLEKVSLEGVRSGTATSSTSQPVDELGEEQSIVINVDDDDDEEEDETVDVDETSIPENDVTKDVTNEVTKEITNAVTEDVTDDAVKEEASDVGKAVGSDEVKEVTEDVTTCTNDEEKERSVEGETEDAVETKLVVEGCVSDHDQEITTKVSEALSVEETEEEKIANGADAESLLKYEAKPHLSESSDKESNISCRLTRDTRVGSSDSCKEAKDNYKLVVEELTKLEDKNSLDVLNGTQETNDADVHVEEVEEEKKETEVVEETVEDTIDLTKSTPEDQSRIDNEGDDDVINIDVSEAPKIEEQSRTDEKEVESETDIKIVDTGSSENSNEQDASACPKPVADSEKDANDEAETEAQHLVYSTRSEEIVDKEQALETEKETLKLNKHDTDEVESSLTQTDDAHRERSTKDSASVAIEVLQEVFDLATAEVQKRQDNNDAEDADNTDAETLENITREIENSADMPSLDPINNIADTQEKDMF